MRFWTSIAAALLVLGLAGAVQAKGKDDKAVKTKQRDVLRGKVVSVAADGKSFVLKKQGKKGKTVTETLADSTKIRVKTAKNAKAQPGTVTDLKAGEHVRVTPAKGTPKRVVILELAKTHKAAATHKKGKGHKKA